MSEVMISRRGGGSGGSSGNGTLFTEIITDNRYYTVPNGIKNNELRVRIFGGGGGYGMNSVGTFINNCAYGGGSGWMNNDIVTLLSGVQVYITIGNGGKSTYINSSYVYAYDGGTTSFGGYLSANGGESSFQKSGNGGASGAGYGSYVKPISYQFGGGAGASYSNGGDGGVWGGGGGCVATSGSDKTSGNGGTYGGGGGAIGASLGKGGTYGGNGGTIYNAAENGTNTIGMSTVPNDCWGSGECGCLWTPRTFDNVYNRNYTRNDSKHACCGGGGYGGNGGDGMYHNSRFSFAGGGGGYGGNGGGFNGNNLSGGSWTYSGGGYGKGADGAASAGGAGYYTPAIIGYSGGVAYNSWGRGGNSNVNNRSGIIGNDVHGTSGVCIIQYYV